MKIDNPKTTMLKFWNDKTITKIGAEKILNMVNIFGIIYYNLFYLVILKKVINSFCYILRYPCHFL